MTRLTLFFFLLSSCAGAQETHPARIDSQYWTAFAAAGAATAFDAVTTVMLVHPRSQGGTCQYEAGTPWLYGTHPRGPRVAMAMGGEFMLAGISSHYLRHQQSRVRHMWLMPLASASAPHAEGGAHNLAVCR